MNDKGFDSQNSLVKSVWSYPITKLSGAPASMSDSVNWLVHHVVAGSRLALHNKLIFLSVVLAVLQSMVLGSLVFTSFLLEVFLGDGAFCWVTEQSPEVPHPPAFVF